MKPMRAVALVALMLVGAVTHPTADYGECGYLWVGGEPGGQDAIGWSWVEPYGGYCWTEEVAAWVEVNAPGGGHDEGFDGPRFGWAFAEAAAPLPAGATGTADVHGQGALAYGSEGPPAQWIEYYEDYFSYTVSVPADPPGGGQCTAFGSVFVDHNQNGVFDGGDDALSGTTVYLTDYGDTAVIDVYATGPEGGYQFAGLAEGSYRVKHPVPGGYVATTDPSVPFSACSFTYNFGVAPVATPPTISFSPGSSQTANYNSGDVIITASVSPPGQGWEQQLSWVGEGEPTGDPMQRRFSTNAVGSFGATAVIAGQTEASVTVKVVPVLVLNPTYIEAVVQPPNSPWPYVAISAQVFPTGAAPVVWSGAGWDYGESSTIRYVAVDVVGTFDVFAQAGESQQQQAQVKVVPQPPVLKVVLDQNFDFDPGVPSDDSPTFIPGANSGGFSIPVSEMRTTGQIVRLIAFFHVPGNPNQIASPPVSSVTFSLEDTTAWTGFATNAGWTENPQSPDARDAAPDYALAPVGGAPVSGSLSADFGDGNIAIVELRVRDYGGRTRVRATAAGQEPTLSLPLDAGNNWIPDYGWLGPDTEVISDNFGASDVWNADNDTITPAAASPPAVGLVGDGFKVFEEYRGFVVNGVHRRTNPGKKDLFVSSLVQRNGLSREQSLDFARESLATHGARLHYIRDHTDAATPSEAEYRLQTVCPESPNLMAGGEVCIRYLNFNSGLGPGLTPPFTGWQRTQGTLRLTIREDLITPTTVGQTRGSCVEGGSTPAIDSQAYWIFVAVNRILANGQVQGQGSNSIVNNEVRRTSGHEIGHALHVNHNGGAETCQDSATPSNGTMMDSAWGGGVGAGDLRSQYNDVDVRQMRWHLNAN